MSKMWQPQPLEVLEMWLNSILDEASDNLNDWETKFIDAISIKIANKQLLTQAQEEKFEQLYARHTS